MGKLSVAPDSDSLQVCREFGLINALTSANIER